ncbi:uncharacterized protein LOC121384983 [Gigantopelta aegis]|uniref:uncharacterized protein LOC121384983 n=1 Tax=Gigantopelta aegis TaxID=1735272 RepID=UPI001B88B521|nr:uncharacterized protein LOC121384983 [Gigantopelta aegis]
MAVSDRIRDLGRIGDSNRIPDSPKYRRIKEQDELAATFHPADVPDNKKFTKTETPKPDCVTKTDGGHYDSVDYNSQIDYPLYEEEEYSDYYDRSKTYDYQRHRQLVNNDYSNPVIKKPMYSGDFKNGYQQKVKLGNDDYYDQTLRQGGDYPAADYVIAKEQPSGSREVIGQNSYQDSQPSPHKKMNGYALPEFTCPSVFGIYPDPIDCRQFYQCVWFVPFHHMCGIGTVWNQHMKICDWPGSNSCFT